jgi:hypothetical protein
MGSERISERIAADALFTAGDIDCLTQFWQRSIAALATATDPSFGKLL